MDFDYVVLPAVILAAGIFVLWLCFRPKLSLHFPRLLSHNKDPVFFPLWPVLFNKS